MLLVGTLVGMDGVEWLKTNGFEPVVTSTNLTITPVELQNSSLGIVSGKAAVLTPDRVVRLSMQHIRVTFTPVVYKNQHKGFRITRWGTGAPASRVLQPEISYLALSDTPMEVGEEDMALTLEKGEWVKPEESKQLVVDKLGWDAEDLIRSAKYIMSQPGWKEQIASGPEWAKKLWDTLVEHGLITEVDVETPIVEVQDTETEAPSEELPSATNIEPTPSVTPPPTPSHDELPPVTVTESKPSATLLFLLCGLATLGLCAVVYVVLKRRK